MDRSEYPEPLNVRDLWLMYETCGKFDGIVEYAPFEHEDEEGAIWCMQLRVVPDRHLQDIHVVVEREQMTNVRKRDGGCSYSPHRIVDWERRYGFDEFRESPFFAMVMEEWGSRWRTRWDTRLMDDHSCVYADGSVVSTSYVTHHFYGHEKSWYGSRRLSGEIRMCDFSIDDNGGCSIYLDDECFYDGDFCELADIVREHERMRETMDRLKEHGIDLEGGTLSIRLWDE